MTVARRERQEVAARCAGIVRECRVTRSPDGWLCPSFDGDQIRGDQAGLRLPERALPLTAGVCASLFPCHRTCPCVTGSGARALPFSGASSAEPEILEEIHHRGQRSHRCIRVTSPASSWWEAAGAVWSGSGFWSEMPWG